MNWIINNAEWIFSGIGVSILGIILGFFIKKNKENKNQNITSGKNCTNIQGGKDVNVNIGGKFDE